VKYLTPFAFLALLPLGMWLGGTWSFAEVIAIPLGLAVMDEAFGDEDQDAPNGRAHRWLPRTYVLLQLAANGVAAAVAIRPGTAWVETVGLVLSCGLTTGVFGFVAAHELIHSRSPRDRALGLTFLISTFYAQFRIAHIHGHHRRGATLDDPASARLGETLYAFLLRSIVGQFREAWRYEAPRPNNRLVLYLVFETTFLILLVLVDVRLLAFIAVVGVLAVLLLETFNYVAHYGLTRRIGLDGRPERLGPQHSWNSRKRMNNAALLNMGRHSDHHRHAARSYQRLAPIEGAALLPSGYASALMLALIPPLWREVMDPRARAVMAAPHRD
jgi:alkane 1-monooxygenase